MFYKFKKRKNLPKTLKEEKKVELDTSYSKPVHISLETNLDYLKNVLGESDDFVIREFETFINKPIKVFICFINGLVDTNQINQNIAKPLMEPNSNHYEATSIESILNIVKGQILTVNSLKEMESMDEVLEAILSGQTALFVDGYHTVLSVDTQGFASRAVDEPQTETVVRGPREGFTENLEVNTSLIRRKIINPNLTFEKIKLGKQTNTTIRIGYIKGIANPKVINEVKKRLRQIDTDAILESGYIEQLIEDHPFSILPLVGNSEKPDIVAAKLLEGKVSILCNGTPFVLTIPQLFIENLHSSEDYYSKPYLSSLIRLYRLLALFITISLPAIYVALSTYHQGMLPTVLLTSIAASEEPVPFPTVIEALLMLIIFTLLREAGTRMPKAVGGAVTIVGGLILGEAAVQAGFVSYPMIIVVAITGICVFVVSPLSDFIIISRLALLIISGLLGLYGLVLGGLFLLIHMCSLRSFGTPYLAPFAPVVWEELKDSLIRVPFWFMKDRPVSITGRKSRRQHLTLSDFHSTKEGEKD
ncbi:spore germination protein [Halalkalibacter lacteus]|uniref:spore germination protein n=1 Tax=Halalkalibacter lacteus TaxID=3090663 RepID=UPI002FC73620